MCRWLLPLFEHVIEGLIAFVSSCALFLLSVQALALRGVSDCHGPGIMCPESGLVIRITPAASVVQPHTVTGAFESMWRQSSITPGGQIRAAETR